MPRFSPQAHKSPEPGRCLMCLRTMKRTRCLMWREGDGEQKEMRLERANGTLWGRGLVALYVQPLVQHLVLLFALPASDSAVPRIASSPPAGGCASTWGISPAFAFLAPSQILAPMSPPRGPCRQL